MLNVEKAGFSHSAEADTQVVLTLDSQSGGGRKILSCKSELLLPKG